ncbi:LytTR family DNA-binding domain-containing protein [Flavobacterium cerinum]|uniref:LytTR family transcriptional regulator n=1 Tax=Flavobacterium cerinum TaxID=2502784 RepID=A0ABY5IS31_9FLAO|nr:LytTR family DNA-binding domain-containing protein [Flavobacterium cerinum]UUC44179.1 LytTR family transcriptional regulator [Flavobacterium cerinum]
MLVLKYHPRWVRVVVAIIASLFILFYGRPLDLVRSFGSMQFYPVFIVSSLVSFAMVEMTHQFTRWLDRRDPWSYQWQERAILQFTLGVQVPLIFDVFLFSVYFAYYGIDITQNGFFSKDFPLIASFMLLLNAYYAVRFYFAYGTKSRDEILVLENSSAEVTGVDSSDLMRIENNGITINLDLGKDIILFAYINRQLRVYDREGKIYPVKDKLTNLINELEDKGYCQINRSTIVNLEAVKGYKIGAKRNTLELFIVTDLDEIDEDKRPNLTVTGENIDDFKSKFDIR